MSSIKYDPNKSKKKSKEIIFKVIRQISYTNLFKKYTSGKYSYSKISINHLLFNESSEIVARFKDFLIYDDSAEIVRRFYPSEESNPRLKKILIFYEKYSRIFPNYLVLKENKYLYRNIRKKQKMINAINEIKKEEKENKKKLGIKNDKIINTNNKLNELFTKKIKDDIKIFQKNLSGKIFKNSFDTDNQNEEDTLLINQNSISISIFNWKDFEKNNIEKLKEVQKEKKIDNINIDSFITNKSEESITKMLSILNDNKIYIKDLQNIFMENKKFIFNSNIQKQKIKIDKKTASKNLNYKMKNYKSELKNSSNATTSSSILSKKIQRKVAIKNDNKVKEENKNNNFRASIKSNEIHKKLLSKKNKDISKNNTKNKKNNLYQNISPEMKEQKYKKHFFSTSNNFNNIKNLKTPTIPNENNKKNKKIFNNINNTEKKEMNNKAKTKIINTKNKSQDLRKQFENKNKEKILTYNNTKKYFTENNPFPMTGDMKNKGKNIVEKKVHVNLRDIIKNNKKNQKFNTAIKEQKKYGLLLKSSKKTIDSKNLKFYENKSDKNINTLANLHCNKYKLNTERNSNYNSIPIKKTEEEKRKETNKLMSKKNKSKTKSIFTREIREINRIKPAKSNSKINNLKKRMRLFNSGNNNNSNNIHNNIEKFHTHGNTKINNIRKLTPIKSYDINTKSKNQKSNENIKNNLDKIIKTISNGESQDKEKAILNNKNRIKSNINSKINLNVLHKIQSTKNNTKKIKTYYQKDKIIKTPDINKKTKQLFKKNKTVTEKKLTNYKEIKEKGQNIAKKITSYTIKVNKNYINGKKYIFKIKEK